ncbi:membrane protein [Paraoerskovia sediminicola]|uniref:Membrane protein n=1 Tax=Paraoerskovia sediminicola TaxID=1138587 RepID=A0ABM8G668_9CELL|nr:PepSY domain-containing protein [Paraoerskovia sediminicola]BDZ43626.1 membrane protein [Paraoerskovia sediminicola]
MTDTVVSTTPAPPDRSPVRPERRRRPPWFGALLRRLHFYAGILVGPFILVAAVSGALYALTPAIEDAVYDHELHAPVTGATVPLDAQVTAAQEHVGDGATISAVRPAPEPGDTTRVLFHEDGMAFGESRAVFVDPGTGEVRGDLAASFGDGLPVRTWVAGLHSGLHLGDPGRFYSELAASWLGIIVVAGLALWLVRIRKTRRKADLLRPAVRAKGYKRLFSWHASVGLWVVIGALVLSATGITWSQLAGKNVSELRTALDWQTPRMDTTLASDDGASIDATEDTGDTEGTVDAAASEVDAEHADHVRGTTSSPSDPAMFPFVLAAAQRANIDSTYVEIVPPADAETAWVVSEIKRTVPTAADAVAFDPETMLEVDRSDFANFPISAKLARWGTDLHMGVLFGVANQVVLFLLAVGIGALVVLGYAMWWKRRPPRGSGRVGGPAPEQGALRDAPWWGLGAVVLGAVVLGAVVLGLWLPLVGFTLVGFVVVDVVAGAVARASRHRSDAVRHSTP